MAKIKITHAPADSGYLVQDIVPGQLFRYGTGGLYLRTHGGAVSLDSFLHYTIEDFSLSKFNLVEAELVIGE